MKKLILLTAIVVCCFSGFEGFTQSATLQGTVVDSATHETMPFVDVRLYRPDGTQAGGTISNSEGKYIMKPITPGQYYLVAIFVSYHPVKIMNITLMEDSVKTVDFEMAPGIGSIQEESIIQGLIVRGDMNDYDLVKIFNQQMDYISLVSTVDFLNTFSRKSNDAEYLVYRNETLFKLLKAHPDIYLSAMCRLSDTLQWEPILKEIESPASDDIDVASIRVAPADLFCDLGECRESVLIKTIGCLDKASFEFLKAH